MRRKKMVINLHWQILKKLDLAIAVEVNHIPWLKMRNESRRGRDRDRTYVTEPAIPTWPQSMQFSPITTLWPICKPKQTGHCRSQHKLTKQRLVFLGPWWQKLTWTKLSIFEWSPITVSLQLHQPGKSLINILTYTEPEYKVSTTPRHIDHTFPCRCMYLHQSPHSSLS